MIRGNKKGEEGVSMTGTVIGLIILVVLAFALIWWFVGGKDAFAGTQGYVSSSIDNVVQQCKVACPGLTKAWCDQERDVIYKDSVGTNQKLKVTCNALEKKSEVKRYNSKTKKWDVFPLPEEIGVNLQLSCDALASPCTKPDNNLNSIIALCNIACNDEDTNEWCGTEHTLNYKNNAGVSQNGQVTCKSLVGVFFNDDITTIPSTSIATGVANLRCKITCPAKP